MRGRSILDHPGRPSRRKSLRPRVEAMEDRRLLATFTVTQVGDDGAGSLRQAIQDANRTPGLDVIDFRIASGPQSIAPATALPEIDDPVAIDATTQPGYDDAPIIELSGVNISADPGADGLRIFGGGSTVRGLVINQFGRYGLVLDGNGQAKGGNVVEGNDIGTDVAGQENRGNAMDGIYIHDSPGNRIGGAGTGAPNLISGNGVNGILISGAGAAGNVVAGNRIGTDRSGSAALGNSFAGVMVQDAPRTVIGGTDPGAGNLISANLIYGLDVEGGSATGTLVQGNMIGTNADGRDPLGGQDFSGVRISVGASDSTIGGVAAGSRNLISGNGRNNLSNGVLLDSPETTGNVVQGNYIGVDVDGARALGNFGNGVMIGDSSGNVIGGADPRARNVISGNRQNGVLIDGTGHLASGNAVLGNYIGTDATGQHALGNGTADPTNPGHGVRIQNTSGNTIGGSVLGAGDVISGQPGDGVLVMGDPVDPSGAGAGPIGNVIQGNFIGTDPAGAVAIPNALDGVSIVGSRSNTVGGTIPAARNVLSGNGSHGVMISSVASTGNLVLGNYIGTDGSGGRALGNTDSGVDISGAAGNTVGALNVISGNKQDGLVIEDASATGNLVRGNLIGTDSSGTRDLGNAQSGVLIRFARGNLVGGPAAGDGNLISGNDLDGVFITGTSAAGNAVQGNLIGTDLTGSADLGNANHGVLISDASDNRIGGTDAGARNVLSGNDEDGVRIDGVSTRNVVQGNLIGTDASGTSALGNDSDGVEISNAPGNTVGGLSPGSRNVISGNSSNGINLNDRRAVGNAIQGNYIGTDAAGTGDLGNGADGVFLLDVAGATIGGPTEAARNVLSGNGNFGVDLLGQRSSANWIVGNRIGTDASGVASLGNSAGGILVNNAPMNFIGGTTEPAGNLISGNKNGVGVELFGPGATGEILEGNLVGTDRDGRAPLANGTGIRVNNAPGNNIGGATPGSRNLVSGNAGEGVLITGSGATNNLIQGNFVGTDVHGRAPLGNRTGVAIREASSNVIGGTTAETRNLISGNDEVGLRITGDGATGNLVLGNFIGTDRDGLRPVLGPGDPASAAARQDVGILLSNGGVANTIGGATAGSRNLISGDLVGVYLAGFNTQSNLIQGNFVGTDATGAAALGNTVGLYLNDASGNTVGGTTPGAGNVISGNSSVGAYLFGALATGNAFLGNLIGTNAGGVDGLRKPDGSFVQGVGLFISGAPGNLIGSPSAGAGNLIAGHASVGVYVFGAGATGNVVQGNRIGLPMPRKGRARSDYGVLLFNAPANTVTRSGPARNRFAGHTIADFREFSDAASARSAGRTTRAAALGRRAVPAPTIPAINPSP